jgi:hypothetical protein
MAGNDPATGSGVAIEILIVAPGDGELILNPPKEDLSTEGGLKEPTPMESTMSIWVCTSCGYSSFTRFEGDICPKCHLTFWKCADCAFTVIATRPPVSCPECGMKFRFANITCYIPEWEDNEPVSPFSH